MKAMIVVAFLAAACTTAQNYSPRYWVSYRAALIETTNRAAMSSQYKSVPFAVMNAYSECTADYVISFLTPEERAKMDEYAQLKRSFTNAEYAAFEAKLKAGGAREITARNLDDLAGTCPDDVPTFKTYFKP